LLRLTFYALNLNTATCDHALSGFGKLVLKVFRMFALTPPNHDEKTRFSRRKIRPLIEINKNLAGFSRDFRFTQ